MKTGKNIIRRNETIRIFVKEVENLSWFESFSDEKQINLSQVNFDFVKEFQFLNISIELLFKLHFNHTQFLLPFVTSQASSRFLFQKSE